jgi:hypothetical protein
MNTSFNSKTADTNITLEISQTLRELVAAMPIVIFANAVAAAIRGSRGPAASSLRTSRR